MALWRRPVFSKGAGLDVLQGKLGSDGVRDVVTREAVAALLDGATPLHCAALAGNPTRVEQLLFDGADPLARTAAGPVFDENALLPGRPASLSARVSASGLPWRLSCLAR
jgi:Ankyrin repeat